MVHRIKNKNLYKSIFLEPYKFYKFEPKSNIFNLLDDNIPIITLAEEMIEITNNLKNLNLSYLVDDNKNIKVVSNN